MTKAELIEALKDYPDDIKICIWASNESDTPLRDPGGTYDIIKVHCNKPCNQIILFLDED